VKQSEGGTKFVVLSSQRSGSTWLVSLLNQVEGTRAYGELFLRRKKTGPGERWDDELSYPRFPEVSAGGTKGRPRLIFSYLDTLFRQPGAVGFKLMYTQLQKYPEIIAYLILHRIRIVHLVRQNQLDVLISRAVKNKTKRTHLLSGDSLPEDIQIDLNPKKLMIRLKRRQKRIHTARLLLHWSTLPNFEVSYEDLLGDSTSFQQICRFLGIDMGDQLPESKLVKIGRKSQAEMVRNYTEVKEVLHGTPFASWLDPRVESNADRQGFEHRVGTR
jgi:LPS sulfotransferase NodH